MSMLYVKRYTLINALQVAAMQYARDAENWPSSLGTQFSNQSKEASDLADRIEQTDVIELED